MYRINLERAVVKFLKSIPEPDYLRKKKKFKILN